MAEQVGIGELTAMADYFYACGMCEKVMKETTASVACIQCRHWIHLKKRLC